MRCSLLVLLALLSVTTGAHAGEPRMDLALGAGVDVGDRPGWAVRLGETIEISKRVDGLIYGTACGYEYWRGSEGSGFHVPIGGYAGVRAGGVTSTLGGGIGVLAVETIHHDSGFGIVPHATATLGFALDDRRTVTLDGRLSRHVLGGAPDFTRWSVLLMIGTTLGR